MQLGGGLEQQEQATPHQDQVPTGEGVIPQVQNGGGQGDQPGHHAQEPQAHQQGQRQADDTGLVPLGGGQLFHQDGDEDQVVDPEHDFQDDQGKQTDPDVGIQQQFHVVTSIKTDRAKSKHGVRWPQ